MSKNSDNNSIITYEGCNFLRQRLILSTLSGKAVKIKNIRPRDEDPGLKGNLILQKRFSLIANNNKYIHLITCRL